MLFHLALFVGLPFVSPTYRITDIKIVRKITYINHKNKKSKKILTFFWCQGRALAPDNFLNYD
jgi:hypothetical protein